MALKKMFNLLAKNDAGGVKKDTKLNILSSASNLADPRLKKDLEETIGKKIFGPISSYFKEEK